MHAQALGVDWLLAPGDPAHFFAEYWEKRPFTIARGDAGYYGPVLTLADLDSILASHDLRFPGVALFKDRNAVASARYTADVERKRGRVEGVVDPVKLYAEFQAGATVILDHLHRGWPALARLCAAMEEFFSHPAQTNVYLTPPRSQGFAPHYDTHDVFILQVAGSKSWRLYSAPMPLPLPTQPYPPTLPPGQPTSEFELRPGDLLYLPRGWMHEAYASETASVHVTLGIAVQTWADLLREALDALLRADVRFRRALPVGFARDRVVADRARGECAEIARGLSDGLRLEKVFGQAAERFLGSRPARMGGHLTQLESLPRLTPQSRLTKRAWMCRLALEWDSVVVYFHGKSVTLPRATEGPLRFVLDTDVFTADALPGPLDRKGKMDLVRRLVEEGFLTTVAGESAVSRNGAEPGGTRVNGVLGEKL